MSKKSSRILPNAYQKQKIIYHFERLLAMGMSKEELRIWVNQILDKMN